MNITNVIASSEYCLARIKADVYGKYAIKLERLPLPIGPIKPMLYKPFCDSSRITIGCFGDARFFPTLRIIIDAFRTIKKKRECFLLLAGPGYNEYLEKYGEIDKGIVVIESSDRDRFQSAMAEIDVAVQMRYPFTGESLSVIHELLALGKRIIMPEGIVDKDLLDLVQEVSPDISTGELVELLDKSCPLSERDITRKVNERRRPYAILNLAEKIIERGL
jgi:hypothetical protein